MSQLLKNNSIFFVISLGMALVSIDASIVNVALPTLSKQFHVPISHVQWVVTGYLLTICALLPFFGRLGDIYSRGLTYFIGMIIFFISSALCGSAFSFWSLVAFRVLQGIGAAMIMATNQALIITSFPREKQGRALGINTMLFALGATIGPGLGGLLLHFTSWRLIFYINIPVGLVGCILGYYILSLKISKKDLTESIDFLGTSIFALCAAAFIIGLTYNLIYPIIISLLLLILFIKWEKRCEYPVVDLNLFKNRIFSLAIIATFIAYIATACTILLPFYFEDLMHLNPAEVGMLLLIAPLMTLLIAPISGRLTDKYRQSLLATIGLTIVFISLIIPVVLNIASSLWPMISAQILFGLGLGIFLAPNNYSIMTNVPTDKIGLGSSLGSLTRNSGRTFGVAVAVFIFAVIQKYTLLYTTSPNKETLALVYGLKIAFLVSAILIAIAAFVSYSRR